MIVDINENNLHTKHFAGEVLKKLLVASFSDITIHKGIN